MGEGLLGWKLYLIHNISVLEVRSDQREFVESEAKVWFPDFNYLNHEKCRWNCQLTRKIENSFTKQQFTVYTSIWFGVWVSDSIWILVATIDNSQKDYISTSVPPVMSREGVHGPPDPFYLFSFIDFVQHSLVSAQFNRITPDWYQLHQKHCDARSSFEFNAISHLPPPFWHSLIALSSARNSVLYP